MPLLLKYCALSDPVPFNTVVQRWLLATDHDHIAVGLPFESPSMHEECLYNTSRVVNIEVLVSGYGIGPQHRPMYASFCNVMESELNKVLTFGQYTEK